MSGGGLALHVWLVMSLFKIAITEMDASAIKAQVRHTNKTPQKRQGLCYNSTLIEPGNVYYLYLNVFFHNTSSFTFLNNRKGREIN